MLPLYQCIQKCGGILIAASTSHLDSFSLEDGSQLSSWTCSTPSDGDMDTKAIVSDKGGSHAPKELDSAPPAKRRRLSESDNRAIANGKSRKTKTEQSNAATKRPEAPAIIALTSTKGGKHVIAVTGGDKSIRVFEHDGNGHLHQLSRRPMPKRPCALAITVDDSTIICADKFGDAYSLPLLAPGLEQRESEARLKSTSSVPATTKPFIPAANDLTVHSVRNRRALQNQMRQTQQASEKLEPNIEQKLLLGHVSMLTDISLVEFEGRSYIITADRDEHIRITRGIPQSHIIEGYCLGHREFVSQLCFPRTRPHLLISGGGDDELYVWNWLLGKLLYTVDLRDLVEKVMVETAQGSDANSEIDCNHDMPSEPPKIAISRIRHLERQTDQRGDTIIVACEGIPALLIYSLSEDSNLSHYQTIMLEGNPLDVVVDGSLRSLIVALDCIHEPGSTSRLRGSLDAAAQPLQTFCVKDGRWVSGALQFNTRPQERAAAGEVDLGSLSSLLYNLQTLRKHWGEE